MISGTKIFSLQAKKLHWGFPNEEMLLTEVDYLDANVQTTANFGPIFDLLSMCFPSRNNLEVSFRGCTVMYVMLKGPEVEVGGVPLP